MTEAITTRHKVPKEIGGYRLITKLGQGGMAAVFKALQVSMKRTVALKVLAPGQAQDPTIRARFIREAQLAGRIQHQNVISCYDIGEADGHMYMALELAEKGDVGALARELGGCIPERMGLSLMRDCIRGMDAIHRAGLLHRDVKPSNIFLKANMSAKLADLGVTREVRNATTGEAITSNAIVGSPAYMAPEQARGESPDFRGDIYSFGATFFHLLTGFLPYSGSTPKLTIELSMIEPTPDVRKHKPHISPSIASIIHKAMQKHRDDRQGSAIEVMEQVERLCERASMSPNPPPAYQPTMHDIPSTFIVPF